MVGYKPMRVVGQTMRVVGQREVLILLGSAF
jgi:hypothetical protein